MFVIGKDAEIGGYCKTIKQGNFVWDYSGHFFHFRNTFLEDYVCRNMVQDDILRCEKHTQIFYGEKYIDFPFQKNIHQLDKDEFIDCLYDLFITTGSDYSTFKQMLYAKFGKSIAEKFLIPYNEKLYACDLNRLDVDAMGRFFLMLIRKRLSEISRKQITILIIVILLILKVVLLNMSNLCLLI